jgi:hypothetical protein
MGPLASGKEQEAARGTQLRAAIRCRRFRGVLRQCEKCVGEKWLTLDRGRSAAYALCYCGLAHFEPLLQGRAAGASDRTVALEKVTSDEGCRAGSKLLAAAVLTLLILSTATSVVRSPFSFRCPRETAGAPRETSTHSGSVLGPLARSGIVAMRPSRTRLSVHREVGEEVQR